MVRTNELITTSSAFSSAKAMSLSQVCCHAIKEPDEKETENVNQMRIHGVLVSGSRCEGAAAVSSAELGVEYIISAKAGTATGVS